MLSSIPLMQGMVPVIKGLETAFSVVALVVHDVAAAIAGTFYATEAGMNGFATVLDDAVSGNFKKLIVDAKNASTEVANNFKGIGQQWQESMDNAVNAVAQQWKDVAPLKPQKDDVSHLTATIKNETQKQVEIVKGALDQQLADIDKWKAGVHAAYASGQADAADWQVAEVRAAQASNVAHEDYLQKLIGIYQKAGDAAKVQSTQEQLTALQTKDQATATEDLAKAEEKHRQAVEKVIEEQQKLEMAQVAKDFKETEKAALDLAKSEEALAKAQGNLGKTQATQDFTAQEEAIKQLASIGLISEEQKEQKLRVLYQQEEKDALDALRQMQQNAAVEGAKGNLLFGAQQLADLKTNLADAKGDFNQSIAIIKAAFANVEKANPFLTPAQIDDLHAQLNRVLAAYYTTQAQITSTEDKYEKERMANQKTALGEAIAMAMYAGNQSLAQALKQHQSDLIAIQDQIALKQARGEDVTAMKAQEKELQSTTSVLVKQAGEMNTLRQAWDLFSSDFKKQSKDNDSTAQEMATTFQTAAQGMQSAISSAFAAMVSGSESAGQAIEAAVFSTIGKIAEQWGAYYLARAIADVFDNPAAAGAEFAAGSALEALGGLLGGAASALSSKSTSTATANPNLGSTASTSTTTASTAGPQPVQVANVQHFAAGGVASIPTLAVIGDSAQGGAASEAVIPLENRSALNAIADALVPALLIAMMRSQGVQASSDATPAVSRFFDGGLVNGPLLAMLGDSKSGAAATEAVLPLESESTMARIASSIVSQFRFPTNAQSPPRYEPGATSSLLSNSTLAAAASSIERSLSIQRTEEYGAGASKGTDVQAIATAFAKALNEKTPMSGQIQISLESDIPQLVKKINHSVSTGRARLLASNSIRLTRRS